MSRGNLYALCAGVDVQRPSRTTSFSPPFEVLEQRDESKKAIAIVIAALMLMSIGVALSAKNVNAASMTVELKKPVDGKTWYVGHYYTVTWTYPSGDPSQITSIAVEVIDPTLSNGPVISYYWPDGQSATPPTSCVLYTPNGDQIVTGTFDVRIQVSYYISPGVVATATDSHQVKIVDNIPPTIPIKPGTTQTVILGADNLLVINFYDNSMPSADANHVKLTVDGMPAPSDKVAIKNAGMTGGQVELQTDWLSLGKHKMTLTVIDNAGNKAKASWVVQVVSA